MNTEHASWRLQFRLAYAEKRASEFQTFVHRLFELAFPGDFTPVAPAGSEGDRKCDGLLPSQQRLFQVYAPKQFEKHKLLRKFKQDYEGAVEHWADQFRIWTFVHNSREGLPKYARDFLRESSASGDSPHICEEWGYSTLLKIAMALPDEDLEDLLGAPLRPADFLVVEIADIVQLLRAIEEIEPAQLGDVHPVPHDKMERNNFSAAYQDQIRQGMRRTDQVQRYLDEQILRPMYRDDLAARFKVKYTSLVNETYGPDDIVDELLAWMLPPAAGLNTHAAAVAIIAYFFEQCDIFENPEEMTR